MKSVRMEFLEGLIKSGISPILLEDIPASIFDESALINADCDMSELTGHYEGEEYVAPNWYNKLLSLTEPILVISNINSIKEEEQRKFLEILKYKKVSTFDLPKNTIILVTANNLKENKINEDVYSLMAQI